MELTKDTDKLEFTKLSDEQSQARLSYAMTMSKSRKSEFIKHPLNDNSWELRLSVNLTSDCLSHR